MHIAIIGAGFTGISAAWDLSKFGHKVTLIEQNKEPGGLASGFTDPSWDWSLEHHYHHIFASDKHIQKLVVDMGLTSSIIMTQTKSSLIYNSKFYQLDSPTSLLKFPKLSPLSRMRTAATLAYLKLTPNWRPLDKVTAKDFIISTMGEQAWEILWKPLFVGKFGIYHNQINAAWFWARIHARTKSLGYYKGGFLKLSQDMVNVLTIQGVNYLPNSRVSLIKSTPSSISITINQHSQPLKVDKVLVTLPSPVFTSLVPQLPNLYRQQITDLKGLAAHTLILSLKKPFFTDHTYWLNINESNWPFLAVVEHTNFVDKLHYNNQHLVYIGKYLESTDPEFALDKQALLKLYHPYLKKLSPKYQESLTNTYLFKALFAQPLSIVNHLGNVPSLSTPLPNIYWASMQHVYPWDRGTNFAVDIGTKAAIQINKES